MPRIFSVSYNATLLQTRQMVLESRGYEVVPAEGFTEALEKCSAGKYDLMIIGHSIPHKDKQAIVREFQRDCPAPVLALLRTGEPQLREARLATWVREVAEQTKKNLAARKPQESA